MGDIIHVDFKQKKVIKVYRESYTPPVLKEQLIVVDTIKPEINIPLYEVTHHNKTNTTLYIALTMLLISLVLIKRYLL